jgi:ankyrin repeat protein
MILDRNFVISALKGTIPINQPDIHGCPPLITALRLDEKEWVANLLKKGADPNFMTSLGSNPLLVSMNTREPFDYLRLLLSYGASFTMTYSHGTTPFIELCFRCQFQSALYLLKKGFDINTKNRQNETALHYFCKHPYRSAHINVLEFLLHYGADPTILNYQGQTPLSLLFDYQHYVYLPAFYPHLSLLSSAEQQQIKKERLRLLLHYYKKNNQD